MHGTATLLRTSIGQKVTMAASGVALVLWLLGHMAGNLKAFQGPEKFNDYAEFLREMGAPVFPHSTALWIVRIAILLAVLVHIWAAARLTLMSRAARPQSYGRRLEPDASTYASRTMRWGGVILLLYIVYHLMHLTFGSVHADFVPGDAYHNLVVGLAQWPVSVAYIVATVALGLHLYHGLWSAAQTLGVNHPRYNRLRRPAALAVAGAITAGFVTVPVAVLAGVIQ